VVRDGFGAASFAMGTFIGLSIYMPVYFESALRLAIIINAAGSAVDAHIAGAVSDTAPFTLAFRIVFIAATMCVATSLAFLLRLEERPLRGESAEHPTSPRSV
jgi:hypothetical protein